MKPVHNNQKKYKIHLRDAPEDGAYTISSDPPY